MRSSNISTLKQLLAFQTVAKLGSVSRAAEELHITQSAVSIQISAMESAFGTPLLLRTGHGVRLTDAGENLCSYVERVLAAWSEMTEGMAASLGGYSGNLRVGAVLTSEYWLPSLLMTFLKDNAKVRLKLHVANRDEVLRSLNAQEIEIALMGNPPEELQPSAAAFAKNPMGFVVAPHHPLATLAQLTLANLTSTNLLVRERGSGSRTTLTRLFKEAGLNLHIGWELSSNEVIKQMCMAGFGPAYLAMHTCGAEIKAGLLQLLPLKTNPIDRIWYVVQLPSKSPSSVATAFRRFLLLHGQAQIDHLIHQREHQVAQVSSPFRAE
jgi:LysR family transcriptional regulator, low CO2-responsive transcriptional regulator